MGIVKIIFLLLALCFLTNPCFAARGFGSTYGVGATDQVAINSITFTTTHSTSVWFFINSAAGAAVANRIYDADSGVTAFSYTPTTTATNIGYGFSGTGGNWTIAAPSRGVWHNVVITYDGSSTANNPIVYLDGVSVTVTRTIAPVGTYTGGAVAGAIGQRHSGGARVWDGSIAEFSLWENQILTANEALALSKGVSPLKIRSAATSTIYLPLFGKSGEQSWGKIHTTQTITGTAFQPHAPVMSLYPLQ